MERLGQVESHTSGVGGRHTDLIPTSHHVKKIISKWNVDPNVKSETGYGRMGKMGKGEQEASCYGMIKLQE